MDTTMKEIFRNEEFLKLANIGGHKKYHQEGDALIHTLNVVASAGVMFNDDPLMVKIAALHDIGKIYTSICHGEDDWEYPDHAMCGSFRGILSKFVPESDPDFPVIQWYIRNHIKPLFWMDKDPEQAVAERESLLKQREAKMHPEKCKISLLSQLALCDIDGSKSVEPQTKLVEYLTNIVKLYQIKESE